jgi:glycolate oxidase FAD binding subunit
MKTQNETPWTELGGIVGSAHLRPSTPADAVDGAAPQMVIEPGSAEELAAALRCVTAAGLAIAPRGSGTKLGWGNPPQRCDAVLSTARLNRLLEHAWADLTVIVEAGCTVDNLQRALAQHGQRLAVDPLWPERATIGGILATNDSGTFRIRFGALRDLIIGVTLALPDGTLAKSGGKVVKNVAGYDLPKLATGSLGTLGVITQAIFRLHPLPHEVASASIRSSSPDESNKLILAIQDSRLAFTGLQLRAQSSGDSELDVRFEGTPAGMAAQLGELERLSKNAQATEASPATWSARQSLWKGNEPSLVGKFSVLPSELGWFCSQVARLCEAQRQEWKVVAQGVGVGLVRIEAGTEEGLRGVLVALRQEVERCGGSFIVLKCPAGVKSGIDVWGSPGDAQALMVRVKQQLDPTGTLNPGRFVGGI